MTFVKVSILKSQKSLYQLSKLLPIGMYLRTHFYTLYLVDCMYDGPLRVGLTFIPVTFFKFQCGSQVLTSGFVVMAVDCLT